MNLDFRADLHCHSICSDGSDTPLDLLTKAKQANLSGLSITDHDTIKAYTPEFFAYAKALEISILPGVEFSSEMYETSIHILGYGFDLESPSLLAFIEEMQRRRKDRNMERWIYTGGERGLCDQSDLSSLISPPLHISIRLSF